MEDKCNCKLYGENVFCKKCEPDKANICLECGRDLNKEPQFFQCGCGNYCTPCAKIVFKKEFNISSSIPKIKTAWEILKESENETDC